MASSKSQKLEDQGNLYALLDVKSELFIDKALAATAALYVTRNQGKSKDTSSSYPLDKDGKLSSAGKSTGIIWLAGTDS